MENKILLVDGHNLLFQMFFGMPARIVNQDGRGIWGVIGFVGALRKIIEMVKPTHVAVLFDAEHENERTEINAEYKSNRIDYSTVEEEDNPFFQLPYIFEALSYLNIPYAETTNCEVDDWMAGYVYKYGMENKLVISSFDSDFFQLIGENVSVLRYRGDSSIICDENYLHDKFGIKPTQYALFKSLVGDKSDNIEGVKHVGPKTAARLLNMYSSLDILLNHAVEIPGAVVRDAIINSEEKIRNNYKIIHLDGCAELPLLLSEMSYEGRAFLTNGVLRAIGLIK